MERIEAAKAKERMIDAHTVGVENSPQLGKTRDKVASALGVSSNTLKREQYIEDHKNDVDPTEYTDWNEGRISTNKVYTSLKASEEQEPTLCRIRHNV